MNYRNIINKGTTILKKNAIGKVEGSKVDYKFFLAKTLFYIDFYKSLLTKKSISTAILSHQITIRYSVLIWMMLKKNIQMAPFISVYSIHQIKCMLPKRQVNC